MLLEVSWDLQGFGSRQQFRTANRAEFFTKDARLVETGIIALAQADTDIDTLTVEVPRHQ